MSYVKKIFLVIFLCLFFCGCSNHENIDKEKEIYQKYIKQLQKVNNSSKKIPFDIEVRYDKITKNEVRYQVIIDNPRKKLNNISAIVYHDKQTDDIFPNSGIFEEKQTLVPGNKPLGIILVGYIPYSKKIENFKCNIKVMIKYSDGEKNNTVYYVTKKS